jgi:hypothetical protein
MSLPIFARSRYALQLAEAATLRASAAELSRALREHQEANRRCAGALEASASRASQAEVELAKARDEHAQMSTMLNELLALQERETRL